MKFERSLVLTVLGALMAIGVPAQAAKPAKQTTTITTPAVAASAVTVSAPTSAAVETVRAFYDHLIDAMKGGDQLGFSGRYKKLEPAIKAAFDLPTMTRLSIGPTWGKTTPDEQQAVVSAFSDFSVATYASRFNGYDGEEFSITGQKPVTSGVMVETQIRPKDGDVIALNYLMRPDDKGNYRIVDVYLNGSISELATRRAEFSAIVQRDGISALVSALGEKSRHMNPS